MLLSSYFASGAGEAASNGEFASAGTVNGTGAFATSGIPARHLFYDGEYWLIGSNNTDSYGLSGVRYYVLGDADTVPLTDWASTSEAYGNAPTLAPSGAPVAPPSPLGGNLKHKLDGAHHILSYTVDTLPDGATSAKLRIYSALGVLLGDGEEGGDGDDLLSPRIHSINWRGYVALVAINDGGETEGPLLGFDINPSRYNGLVGGAPLPSFDPGPMTSVNETTTTLELDYAPPSPPDPATASFAQLWVGWDEDNLTEWGYFPILPSTLFDPLLARTHIINAPSNPARLAWVLINGAGMIWGEPASLSLASPPSTPPPPVVSIISSTAADVASIAFAGDWDSVTLEYGRVGYPTTTTPITASTIKHLTGLITGAPYQARFVATNAAGSASGPWTPFTPVASGGGGGGTGGAAPSAPGEITLTRLTDTTARVEMPALPSGADALRLVYSSGGAFIADLAGSAVYTIVGLTPETDYSVRAKAINLYGIADGPDLLFTTESTAEQGEGGSGGAPDVPNAPTVAKACAMGGINVYAPIWDTDPEVTSMELRRRVNAGSGFGAWSGVLAVWSVSAGGFFDSDVEAFSTYEYQVKAVNGDGGSDWSAAANITLQSSTLSIAFTSPAASPTTLAKKQTIRVTLTDSAETTDACGGVSGGGACALSSPDLRAYLDGLELAGTWVNVSGTPRNGVWELSWETRDYANGARVLKVTAKGCDCCRAKATRTIATLNNLRTDVGYIEIKRTALPATGWQYKQAAVLLQNEPVSANPMRQFWARAAVSTTDPDMNWESSGISATAKASAFEAMQRITLREGQKEEAADLTQMHAEPILAPAGNEVHFVLQLNPAQVISARLTGCERVAKIEQIRNGEYLVFADSPVGGDAAKAFRFTYSDFVLLADLDEQGAGDTFDVALLNDKLFVIAPDELFAVDLDSGQATLNLSPRGETRAPFAVVTTEDRVLAFFVDDEEEEATHCYDMTFAAPRLLWSLDTAISKVRWLNRALLVASGNMLLSTTRIGEAPEEVHTFAAAITAVGADAISFYVGLSSGAVWRLAGGTWTNETTLANDVAAVGAWLADGVTSRGVAGRADDEHLTDETSSAWVDARVIVPPASVEETVSGITALEGFQQIVKAAIGTAGQPGFEPAEVINALLIGTGDEGVLLMLEQSTFDETQGAFLTSEVSHLGLSAYQGVVPIE